MFPLQMSSQSVSERIQYEKDMNFGRVSSHRRFRRLAVGAQRQQGPGAHRDPYPIDGGRQLTKATQRRDIKRAITLAGTLQKET